MESTIGGKEVVTRFIAGTVALERMRLEVNLVVSGLKLLAIQSKAWNSFERGSVVFTGVLCEWRIKKEGRHPEEQYLEVQCWIIGDQSYRTGRIYDDGANLSDRHVQIIHEHLPVFADGMLATFPDFLYLIKPEIDASYL